MHKSGWMFPEETVICGRPMLEQGKSGRGKEQKGETGTDLSHVETGNEEWYTLHFGESSSNIIY